MPVEEGYRCPHCGKFEPTPPPEPFRRALVLLVGLALVVVSGLMVRLLASILSGPISALAAVSAILGAWGFVYCTYLWISFLLIGALRLPGCEFTAINHALRRKPTHRCVDSVLNSVLDEEELHGVKLPKLLKNESAQKWTIGLALLIAFTVFLALPVVSPGLRADSVGAFAIVYFVYDKTIHRVSIGRKWLTGSGDYKRILMGFLRGRYDPV